MLKDSVLGRIYSWWLYSVIFSMLYAIYKPFRLAFSNSAVVGFLKKDSAIERFYSRCLFTRVVNAIWNFMLRILRAIWNFFAPAADGSFFVKLARGSFVCNFEFLLCAFVLIMFVAPHSIWSNGYAVLAAVGLFGIYAFISAAGKRQVVYPHELGLPFLLFAIACVISLAFTGDISDSVRILSFFFAAFILMYVIMSDLSDMERINRMMGYIYAAVMLTAFYAIVQRFMGVEVSSSFTDLSLNVGVPGRVYSTLDNPNNYAEFLVLFMPLCAAYAMNQKDVRWRFFLSCALVFPMLALVMTYARGCWLSIMLAVLVFAYYSDKKLIPLAFIVALLAVPLVLPLLPDSIITRFSTIFNTKDSSANHRLITWQGIMNMIGDHGITGIGMGPYTFAELYPSYALEGATKGVYHSQMLYFELILETGALGFFSFMWMMLRNVKNTACAICRRPAPELKNTLIACCAAFMGIAVASIFEYIWYYPRILFAFFILLGICLAAMRLSLNESEVKL